MTSRNTSHRGRYSRSRGSQRGSWYNPRNSFERNKESSNFRERSETPSHRYRSQTRPSRDRRLQREPDNYDRRLRHDWLAQNDRETSSSMSRNTEYDSRADRDRRSQENDELSSDLNNGYATNRSHYRKDRRSTGNIRYSSETSNGYVSNRNQYTEDNQFDNRSDRRQHRCSAKNIEYRNNGYARNSIRNTEDEQCGDRFVERQDRRSAENLEYNSHINDGYTPNRIQFTKDDHSDYVSVERQDRRPAENLKYDSDRNDRYPSNMNRNQENERCDYRFSERHGRCYAKDIEYDSDANNGYVRNRIHTEDGQSDYRFEERQDRRSAENLEYDSDKNDRYPSNMNRYQNNERCDRFTERQGRRIAENTEYDTDANDGYTPNRIQYTEDCQSNYISAERHGRHSNEREAFSSDVNNRYSSNGTGYIDNGRHEREIKERQNLRSGGNKGYGPSRKDVIEKRRHLHYEELNNLEGHKLTESHNGHVSNRKRYRKNDELSNRFDARQNRDAGNNDRISDLEDGEIEDTDMDQFSGRSRTCFTTDGRYDLNGNNTESRYSDLNKHRFKKKHLRASETITGQQSDSNSDLELSGTLNEDMGRYEKYDSGREVGGYSDENVNRNNLICSPISDTSDMDDRSKETQNFNVAEWQASKPYSCLKLCQRSVSNSENNCNCDALHICKYFILSECLVPTGCRFGHNINTEHNKRVLNQYFPRGAGLQSLKFVMRQKENRNETTIPQVCKFYNNEGRCKHENVHGTKCQCLHVCKYYVKNSCKFGTSCIRSHSLLDGQPLQILMSYGLNPRNRGSDAEDEILDLLKIHNVVSVQDKNKSKCYVTDNRNEGGNIRKPRDDKKTTCTAELGQTESDSRDLFTSNADYIPFMQQNNSVDTDTKNNTTKICGLQWRLDLGTIPVVDNQKKKRKNSDSEKHHIKKRKKSRKSKRKSNIDETGTKQDMDIIDKNDKNENVDVQFENNSKSAKVGKCHTDLNSTVDMHDKNDIKPTVDVALDTETKLIEFDREDFDMKRTVDAQNNHKTKPSMDIKDDNEIKSTEYFNDIEMKTTVDLSVVQIKSIKSSVDFKDVEMKTEIDFSDDEIQSTMVDKTASVTDATLDTTDGKQSSMSLDIEDKSEIKESMDASNGSTFGFSCENQIKSHLNIQTEHQSALAMAERNGSEIKSAIDIKGDYGTKLAVDIKNDEIKMSVDSKDDEIKSTHSNQKANEAKPTVDDEVNTDIKLTVYSRDTMETNLTVSKATDEDTALAVNNKVNSDTSPTEHAKTVGVTNNPGQRLANNDNETKSSLDVNDNLINEIKSTPNNHETNTTLIYKGDEAVKSILHDSSE